MKKELLIATALVSTLGIAGAVDAASATMSGNIKVGVVGKSPDSSSSDTTDSSQLTNFTVSLSETTDAGVKISTGFDMAEEGSANDPSGLTLTFTDGSSLALIEAGNASGGHAIAVPGGAMEAGISGTSTSNAPTGISFASGGNAVGFKYNTADDFLADGLKASISASFNGDATAVTTTDGGAALENSYAVGVTYVADAGDTAVTVGAGYSAASYSNSLAEDEGVMHIGLSAVTGDLTIAAGYGDGTYMSGETGTAAQNDQVDGNASAIGAKYVSGDMTFNVGMVSGSAKDRDFGNTGDTSADDTYDQVTASVAYTVASGVTANIGFIDETTKDEGAAATSSSGTSWYVGATVSF
jgi:hypothetical protein